jgi:hypothetical protein
MQDELLPCPLCTSGKLEFFSFPGSTSMVTMQVINLPSANLIKRLHAFLAKMKECEPHIADAFLHRELRCGPYTGPSYAAEHRALIEALAEMEGI